MAPQRWESKPADPAPLAKPIHFPFSKRTLSNRFLKGAMSERLATWHPSDLPKRGVPTPELINLYRRWGEGGMGLILTGNIVLNFNSLEALGNPIIPPGAKPSGERFEAFKKLATEAKKEGSLIVGQICHPGRQVEERINQNPVGASDVRMVKTTMVPAIFGTPHAATKQEIDEIVENFAHAAEYLEKAGFDGVQLHGAHGKCSHMLLQ
jgi:2,4-dienoyl-CoA reductase-like NADH-dependent reductase (Old Yellow Enzyme family)